MARIPINIATGSLQKSEIIIGIDLGTTNSLVAIIHPESGQPIALKEHDSAALVPSVVHFNAEGGTTVGEAALPFLTTEPQNTIFSAKRLMGKTYADVKAHADFFTYKIIDSHADSLVNVQVNEKIYSPIELSSFILKALKVRAEHILKMPITKAVITVPAYFNDTQRQATRDAGKLAGLDVLRIINEPTAASLAYGLGQGNSGEQTIAVYDLGGGTFDISILKITDGIFEVLSTNGNTYLGGDDIDQAIVNHWLSAEELAQVQTDKAQLQNFRLAAEAAKKHLTTHNHYTIVLGERQFTLSLETFNKLVTPIIADTLTCCKQAVADAGLSTAQIEHVVMVGGSTRTPAVIEAVGSFFGKPVHNQLNPDEVVALGAAIQADILAGNNRQVLLLDVTPLSLGLETMGGLMDVLIPRNSKIPSRASRQYTTQKDGQGSMRISVFQGERDLVEHNRKLAEFNLVGIPGMPAGFPKVDISFLINADGILQVSAKELRSGVSQTIDIQPQYGLTDAEVERLLLESLTHAKDDIATRALVEARTEGYQLLSTTETFVGKNARQLSPQELTDTAQAMQALQLALSMTDKNLIQAKIEDLNNISRPYAERIMDAAISKSMKGTKV